MVSGRRTPETTSTPLRRDMYYNKGTAEPESNEDESSGGDVRINIRISKKTLAWLKNEAEESATTVSSLCSLAIYDWAEDRQTRRQCAICDREGATMIDHVKVNGSWVPSPRNTLAKQQK